MTYRTARELWEIVVVFPPGCEKPSDQKLADRDRATLIFEQHRDLVKRRGFNSPDELLQKYLADPDGLLPQCDPP